MSITTYKSGVDSQITSQTSIDSIPPSVVGQKFKDLADIASQLSLSVWSSTYPNGQSTGYMLQSIVVYNNVLYVSNIDNNRDIPGTSGLWSILFSQTFQNDIVVFLSTGKTFGKYLNGQTISAVGKTPLDIILDATQEVIHPTYISPTNSLSTSPNPNYQELGSTINIILSSLFTRNNGGDQQSAIFLRDTTTISTDSTPKVGASSVNNSYTDSGVTISLTPVQYKTTISSAHGPILNNNIGQPDPTGRISAGSITSNIVTFQGIYPYFYGSSSSQVITSTNILAGTKVLLPVSTQLIIPSFGSGSSYLWFAVPHGSHIFTTWFRTALDNGSIGGSTNLFESPQTISVISTNWTTNFDLYITNYQTIASTQTTFN